MSEAADAKVREIIPGFHLLHLPLPMRPTIVNVYLVNGGSEWALIDTGMRTPESLDAFHNALESVGCRPEWIRKIICTHHHPDHFGTSGPYKELCHAEVFLHPLEQERVSAFLPHDPDPELMQFFQRNGIPLGATVTIPSLAEFWASMFLPAPLDHLLADGDQIQIGERELRVVWTPGHSPGHCIFHFPKEKVALVGDHLLPKITPHVGIASEKGPENPLGDFLDSLRKVDDLDVETVLPAHGPVFHDHRKRIAQLIEFHDYRLQVMFDVIRGRPRTAYEIALEAFDLTVASPLQQQFPATFETLAHLEMMRRQNRVEKVECGDRILWSPKNSNR